MGTQLNQFLEDFCNEQENKLYVRLHSHLRNQLSLSIHGNVLKASELHQDHLCSLRESHIQMLWSSLPTQIILWLSMCLIFCAFACKWNICGSPNCCPLGSHVLLLHCLHLLVGWTAVGNTWHCQDHQSPVSRLLIWEQLLHKSRWDVEWCHRHDAKANGPESWIKTFRKSSRNPSRALS